MCVIKNLRGFLFINLLSFLIYSFHLMSMSEVMLNDIHAKAGTALTAVVGLGVTALLAQNTNDYKAPAMSAVATAAVTYKIYPILQNKTLKEQWKQHQEEIQEMKKHPFCTNFEKIKAMMEKLNPQEREWIEKCCGYCCPQVYKDVSSIENIEKSCFDLKEKIQKEQRRLRAIENNNNSPNTFFPNSNIDTIEKKYLPVIDAVIKRIQSFNSYHMMSDGRALKNANQIATQKMQILATDNSVMKSVGISVALEFFKPLIQILLSLLLNKFSDEQT